MSRAEWEAQVAARARAKDARKRRLKAVARDKALIRRPAEEVRAMLMRDAAPSGMNAGAKLAPHICAAASRAYSNEGEQP